MSHLRFYRAILSRDLIVIARQSCSMQLCMSYTATLSHKQELANQRSPHFRDEVAQNRALLCTEELRDTPRHTCDFVTRWSCTTKLCNKIAGVTSV